MQNAMETIFTNARIVTPDDVIHGSLRVRDGKITELEAGISSAPGAIDLEGDLVMPGIIDVHTDNLEKHYEPRPGVTWDPVGAAMAHDGQMAMAGVTTVLNSLSVQGIRKGRDRLRQLQPMLAGVRKARAAGGLRIDHRLHLRCEISFPSLNTVLDPLLDETDLCMFSVMDHTPGQRQYRNMTEEQFIGMLADYNRTQKEIDLALEYFRNKEAHEYIGENRELVAQYAREMNVPLATHDDETPEHIDLAVDDGATMSEFPVTLEAAQAAKSAGLIVIMGGPNLLRGGSHSGNVAAAEVAKADALDIIASDYLPMSMLRGAMMLTKAPFDWSVPKAVATVTSGPADSVGLNDRGRIAPGQRADFIRVETSNTNVPIVRETWSLGRRVA